MTETQEDQWLSVYWAELKCRDGSEQVAVSPYFLSPQAARNWVSETAETYSQDLVYLVHETNLYDLCGRADLDLG